MPEIRPVQIFSPLDRVLDHLSHGVLIVPEQSLRAEEGDCIRILINDDEEAGDDYGVDLVVPLRDENGLRRVAVVFSH